MFYGGGTQHHLKEIIIIQSPLPCSRKINIYNSAAFSGSTPTRLWATSCLLQQLVQQLGPVILQRIWRTGCLSGSMFILCASLLFITRHYIFTYSYLSLPHYNTTYHSIMYLHVIISSPIIICHYLSLPVTIHHYPPYYYLYIAVITHCYVPYHYLVLTLVFHSSSHFLPVIRS